MALSYQRPAKQAPRSDLIVHIRLALHSLGRDGWAFKAGRKKADELSEILADLRDEQRAVGSILKETEEGKP